MLRGKESSNRIELSQLVQDLLNFGVLGSLQLWGGGRWVGSVWRHGGVPTCMHIHAHACTCAHAHVYMYRNCKWPLTWRHPCLACMCVFVRACVCVCTWDTPPTHIPTSTPPHTYPPPPHPPIHHPPWHPRNQLKFDNT